VLLHVFFVPFVSVLIPTQKCSFLLISQLLHFGVALSPALRDSFESKFLTMNIERNYPTNLGKGQILDLAKFIVTENFKHHSNNVLPQDYEDDINAIHEEEIKYIDNSEIFVVKNDTDEITGAIRVLKWNYSDVLPIQKIFGINPLLAITNYNVNEIFHIGRFAIQKESKDVNLFKKLMVCAIAPVCAHKGNIAFAEIDSKLLRVLRLLGIKASVIGESIEYLGSETIPVAFTYDGLIDFFNKNKSLVSQEALASSLVSTELPESVVSENIEYNYSLV